MRAPASSRCGTSPLTSFAQPMTFASLPVICRTRSLTCLSADERTKPLAFGNKRLKRRRCFLPSPLRSSEYDDDDASGFFEDYDKEDDEDDLEFLKKEFERLESLEDLLKDVKLDDDFEEFLQEDTAMFLEDADESDVDEIFSLLDGDSDDEETVPELLNSKELENALLQGVVPVSADVGSELLPGDWGFDPLDLASKDYILQFQHSFLQMLPGAEKEPSPPPRPSALILRDYREAEIRHGRLAMLAAVFWPLQEMLDRLLLDEDQFGPLVYDTVTLPYFPLLMTFIMILLGYLDIFAKEIQERENIGDAFLPGDCFWDPLQFLEGAPPSMKRNMQERELFNGRVAMLAIAAFLFEEGSSGLPIISLEGNLLFFVPAYEIPFIQEWLDGQFTTTYSMN